MHPPTQVDRVAAAHAGDFQERLAFARRLANHRAHASMLSTALHRTFGVPPSEAVGGVARRGVAAPPPAWRGMPTTGVRKTFALLIEFQDARHQHSRNALHQRLYGGGGAGAPYDSVAAYYDRASYHRLNLYGGTTFDWYRTAYPRTVIKRTDAGRDRLIKEALLHFHARGHDFRQYDTDGDGMVDFFQVLYAGPDTGWGSTWWAYQASFEDQNFSLDGVKFGKYAWMWESRPVGAPFETATAIHEMGHALGLPDYYDYDRAKGPRGGLGGLDMMDGVKHDHNCFSKWLLDWVKPRPVTTGSKMVILPPSGISDRCVVLWPRLRQPAVFGEFFMVQNRARIGNDTDLPGEGLVIWHVDARLKGGNFACDNSFTDHKLIRLMEADGAEEIEAGRKADPHDFYSEGMSFGPKTVPSSNSYARRRSGVEVRKIVQRATGLSATFALAALRRS